MKPALQRQTKDCGVLRQCASSWQLCVPSRHSSMSVRRIKNNTCSIIDLSRNVKRFIIQGAEGGFKCSENFSQLKKRMSDMARGWGGGWWLQMLSKYLKWSDLHVWTEVIYMFELKWFTCLIWSDLHVWTDLIYMFELIWFTMCVNSSSNYNRWALLWGV